MKKLTKKDYPKVDGERFDSINRKYFDELRESFEWTIKETLSLNDSTKVLTKEQIKKIIETSAWNCAFMVVANRD